MPILPVPLTAAGIIRGGMPFSRPKRLAEVHGLVATLRARNATMHLPEGSVERAVSFGLALLRARGIVSEFAEGIAVVSGQEALLTYSAASVLQRLAEPRGPGELEGPCLTLLRAGSEERATHPT